MRVRYAMCLRKKVLRKNRKWTREIINVFIILKMMADLKTLKKL